MDPARLKIKEKVEAELKKMQQPVVEEEGDGEEGEVAEVRPPPKPTRVRKYPSFLLYFQAYDIATKKKFLEFEDFSESKVKVGMVKNEFEGQLARLLAAKYAKDQATRLVSTILDHEWVYYVNNKNWIYFRKLSSIFPQEEQVLRNQQLFYGADCLH